jgi:hypothetical protein
MELNLIDLTLDIQTSSKTTLSQQLLLAGEEFAEACKQAVCCFPLRHCAHCSARNTCDWQLVFGQQLSTDPEALRRYQKPPLPFVFSVPILDNRDNQAGVLECGMIVVGRAITCLDMLLRGFSVLLAAKNDSLHNKLLVASSRDCQGNVFPLGSSETLSHPENLAVISAEDILGKCPWECGNLTVQLLSPLRLVAHGRLLNRFDFSLFALSLMRRISSMAYYYGRYEFDCNFKELSNLAHKVMCREDHFGTTRGGSWKTAGINGYGCFSGNIGGLLPFFMLGRYLHAGKNAAFGMGAFELDIS